MSRRGPPYCILHTLGKSHCIGAALYAYHIMYSLIQQLLTRRPTLSGLHRTLLCLRL